MLKDSFDKYNKALRHLVQMTFSFYSLIGFFKLHLTNNFAKQTLKQDKNKLFHEATFKILPEYRQSVKD